jgi:hypothetical protein
VLGVSPSGFYASVSRPPSRRAIADQDLLRRIREVHEMSRGTYGAWRVHAEFRDEGVHGHDVRAGAVLDQREAVDVVVGPLEREGAVGVGDVGDVAGGVAEVAVVAYVPRLPSPHHLRVLPLLAVLLAGCVQTWPYGNPSVAELEPLADGWTPNLAVTSPRVHYSPDQYRWSGRSGISVTVGTSGDSRSGMDIEGSVSTPPAVTARMVFETHGDPTPWLDLWPHTSRATPLRAGQEFTLPAGQTVFFDVRGYAFLEGPHAGDLISFEIAITSNGTTELCPFMFAVNHLKE